MDLDQSIRIMIAARVHCGERDMQTPELREALHWLLEHYPETRRYLVEFWHAVEYRNSDDPVEWNRQSALAVPPLHRVEDLTR